MIVVDQIEEEVVKIAQVEGAAEVVTKMIIIIVPVEAGLTLRLPIQTLPVQGLAVKMMNHKWTATWMNLPLPRINAPYLFLSWFCVREKKIYAAIFAEKWAAESETSFFSETRELVTTKVVRI